MLGEQVSAGAIAVPACLFAWMTKVWRMKHGEGNV